MSSNLTESLLIAISSTCSLLRDDDPSEWRSKTIKIKEKNTMQMKGHYTLLRYAELESHHQTQFSVRVELGVMAMMGYSALLRSPELESHYQMQFTVRVELGVMAMKGYSTLLRSPELKPHHQMQFIVLLKAMKIKTSLFRETIKYSVWFKI